MTTEIEYEITEECTYSHLLNNDSLDCHLTNGHAGPHKGRAVDGNYWWQKEPTRTRHAHVAAAVHEVRDGIHVVSYITQDGGSAYVVNATGDSSMTAYLGLLVVAQQEILRWNDDDA